MGTDVIQFSLIVERPSPGGIPIGSEVTDRSVSPAGYGRFLIDVYSCDHFVEPEHLLGNIAANHLLELVALPQQEAFGNAELDSLPGYCRSCDVRFACIGGCPKDRFTTTPDGASRARTRSVEGAQAQPVLSWL